MPREISFGGVLVPGLLPIFLISLLLMLLVDAVVGRYGLHRYVWHPPLFRLALLVCLFAAGGLLFLR